MKKTSYSFNFYRQLLTTTFCNEFQFSQGEQDEFGFQNSFEKNIEHRPHQSQLVSTTSLNVMNWVINMCTVVDAIPMAKRYLSNLFAMTAFFLQCNRNTEVSTDIFNYVRNWVNGKAKAINLPFVAAFVERSLFFTGVNVLTFEYLNTQFETNGLLKVTSAIVEDTRARIPTIHAPRYVVYSLISKIIFSWMISRKVKNKKIPNKELFLKRGLEKLMQIPDMKRTTAALILQLSHEQYLNFLSKIWTKIKQSDIRQLGVKSLSGQTPEDSTLKHNIQGNKKTSTLLKEEKKPLPKIAAPSVQSVCYFCKKSSLDLKRCGKCKAVFYCSAECQKLDWKSHKFECAIMRK